MSDNAQGKVDGRGFEKGMSIRFKFSLRTSRQQFLFGFIHLSSCSNILVEIYHKDTDYAHFAYSAFEVELRSTELELSSANRSTRIGSLVFPSSTIICWNKLLPITYLVCVNMLRAS
jgi:hypothetical protein